MKKSRRVFNDFEGGIGPYASILNQAAQGIGDLIRLAQGVPTSWDIKIQMMGLK